MFHKRVKCVVECVKCLNNGNRCSSSGVGTLTLTVDAAPFEGIRNTMTKTRNLWKSPQVNDSTFGWRRSASNSCVIPQVVLHVLGFREVNTQQIDDGLLALKQAHLQFPKKLFRIVIQRDFAPATSNITATLSRKQTNRKDRLGAQERNADMMTGTSRLIAMVTMIFLSGMPDMNNSILFRLIYSGPPQGGSITIA